MRCSRNLNFGGRGALTGSGFYTFILILTFMGAMVILLAFSSRASETSKDFPEATLYFLSWDHDDTYNVVEVVNVSDYSTFYKYIKSNDTEYRWTISMDCKNDTYSLDTPQVDMFLTTYTRQSENVFILGHLVAFCDYQCIDLLCYYTHNSSYIGV